MTTTDILFENNRMEVEELGRMHEAVPGPQNPEILAGTCHSFFDEGEGLVFSPGSGSPGALILPSGLLCLHFESLLLFYKKLCFVAE